MTKKDFHLASFFLDYNGLMNNKDSHNLSIFIQVAENIFNNELYSDINVKDKEGNTFLHYAMNSSLNLWVDKILRKGGNPLIENNEGRNAFRYAIKNFKSTYKVRIDDSFNNNTLGFCKEFKQVLFNEAIKNGVYDSNYFYKIDDYLQFIDLVNDENKINLSYANWKIPLNEKIDYYLDNFNSSEKNSHFFNCLTKLDSSQAVFKKSKIKEFFLNREFIWDENFKQGLMSLIREVEYKSKAEDKDKESIDNLIAGLNIVFDNQISFEEHIEWNISLNNKLINKDSLRPIYLNEKLKRVLQEKSGIKVKVIKI